MVALLAAVLLAAAPNPPSASAAAPTAYRFKPSRSFPIAYAPPSDKAHVWIYKAAQDQQVLERLSNLCGLVRIPRPVVFRIAGCDGVSNAWYDDTDHTVTFCYEFIADLVGNAPEAAKTGIALDEAVLGPFTYFFLHEVGHALIDVLKLPVLGREEDAADRFAAFVLLQAGPEFAERTLRATAWTFHHDARGRKLDETDFADVHGLDAQRFYDVVCLAYGKDPVTFREAPARTGLPAERAEECAAEWRQVRYGFQTVLAKYIDRKRVVQVREEHIKRMKARPERGRSTGPIPAPAGQPAP